MSLDGLPDGDGCLSVYPLRGDRVLLVPLGPEHAAGLAPLVDDAPRMVAEAMAVAKAERGLTLAVTRRGDHAVLGAVSLDVSADHPDTAEVGYWLGAAHRGLGLGREAVRLALGHAFDDLGLSRVTARTTTDNPASLRLLSRLGFVAAGGDGGSFDLTAAAFRAATARRMLLVTAVALVDPDNRVLLQKRPEGKALAGLWEFPGGKVDPGETPERALVRELHEELGIDVRDSCLAPLTFASHAYDDFHLLMPLYVCRQWKGRVTGREGQELAWVRPARLGDYPMPPADVPLIPILRDWL